MNEHPSSPPLAARQRALSLAGLRGFEAAARLLSLTRAAEELSLTQSAISRQVQGLEEELGVQLFVRRAREISLTPAGRQFLPIVQSVLLDLDNGVERIRREANSPRVAVSTFSSFASLWLIPRLAGFRALRPNADLVIGATDRQVDLEEESVDVAIRYLHADDAPPEARLLIAETLFPLVSPAYLKSGPPLRTLDDLAAHTLIECEAGSPAEVRSTWAGFFASLGMPEIKGRSRLTFDLISQALQTAERGQGVVLGRTYGADSFMEEDLVRPIDVAVDTGAGCYLLVSERARTRSEASAFVDWLLVEVDKFNRELSSWQVNSRIRQPARRRVKQSV